MNRALLLIVAIIVLALASTWLSRETKQEAKQAVSSTVPDYFINNFTATQLGPDGRPVRRLTADQLSHFPTREAVVQHPHLYVFQAEGTPWEMTARTATLDDAATLVELTGDVHLFRRGPDAADVVTDALRVEPPRNYAETDAPITFTSAHGRVQAVGMEAWLDQQRMVLHSRVKGTYETRR